MRDRINAFARRVPTWTVYAAGAFTAVFIFAMVATGNAGPDPVKVLEHAYGERGLQWLIAALCITPLRWAGINLLKFRRAVGLVAFGLIALHFATWIVLDMGLRYGQIVTDLYKRPYILVGFGAFLALIPLAVTSNAASIRRLGAAAWRRLHWLAYPATLAGAVHFVMIDKVWKVESLLYVGVVVVLLAARLLRARVGGRRSHPA